MNRRTEHPCITRAGRINAEQMASPLWRAHWLCSLFVNGRKVFEGCYDGCKVASGAYATQPYYIEHNSGERSWVNR